MKLADSHKRRCEENPAKTGGGEKVRKAITGMAAIVAVAVMFLTSVPPASATKPIPLNFEITSITDSDWVVKVVSDQVTQLSWTEVITYQGELNGQFTWVFKATVVKWESATKEGFGTFEGTVLGRSGTMIAHASQLIWLDGKTQWDMNSIEEDVIFGGTGGLEGVHGTCTVSPHTTTSGVCSIHFK